MNENGPLLEIQVTQPRGSAYAGEWFPLLLILKRPGDCTSPVFIGNITTTDPAIQLDLDLLNRHVPIRPGEIYRLNIPIRVQSPKIVALAAIKLWLKDEKRYLEPPVELPQKLVNFRPAIGNEIAVSLESLCTYDEGTKVLLALKHQGPTVFDQLTVNIQPEQAIRSGKRTIARSHFGPADLEEIELIVDQKEIQVDLVGTVDGQQPEARHTLTIAPPAPPTERKFLFLKPRRLSLDKTAFSEAVNDTLTPIEPTHGSYSLYGGGSYELGIQPQIGDVTSIQVRDIPGVISVRNSERDAKSGDWKTRLDVTYPDVFRRSEVVYYDVVARGEHLTGEVPICLHPPRLKHWQVAGYLGVALTIQGFAAVVRGLREAHFDLTTLFSEFDPRQDYNFLFLLSIPLALMVLKTVDWLQYRLRS